MNFAKKAFHYLIAGHLRRHGYVKTGDRIKGLQFKYRLEFHQPNGECKVVNSGNLLTDQGLQYLGGGTSFEGSPQYTDFFIFLFTNPRVPVVTDTMANLSEYGELVTGIDLTSRPRWDWVKSQFLYDSSADPAVWTVTASSVTVYGIGLTTMSAFGSTGGLLISATMLDSPETVKTNGFIRSPASIEFARG